MAKLTVKRRARANGEGTIYPRTIRRPDGSSYIRWEAKITVAVVNGERQRKTIYGRSQAEVKEKLDLLRAKARSGIGIDVPPFRDFAADWLGEKELRVKQATLIDYRFELDKFVVPYLGHLKLDEITPKRVQAFQTYLAKEFGVKRANRATSRLSMVMNSAVALEHIHRNPCVAISSLRSEKIEMTIWNMVEAQHFIDLAKESPLYDLYYLLMSTGLRRGEALGLRWKDLHGHFLVIRQSLTQVAGRVVFSTPKTKESARTIDISDDVIEMLERRQRGSESELVFVTSNGTPYSPRNVLRDFECTQNRVRRLWLNDLANCTDTPEVKELRRKLEQGIALPHARLHDLRHYHASVLILVLKKSPLEVAARLGHTNPSFTMNTYAHLFDEQRTQLQRTQQNTAPSLLEVLGRA